MTEMHLGRRLALACIVGGSTLSLLFATSAGAAPPSPKPKFTQAVAYDVSRQAREIAPAMMRAPAEADTIRDIRPDRGPLMLDQGFSGDGALFPSTAALMSALSSTTIAPPLVTFEGLSNQDNVNVGLFLVAPPDPVGDVGPNHYVEMVNLAFAVYDKQGTRLAGPFQIGALWAGFAVADCAEPSGDPIVLYDQLADRWILSQFTATGPEYWNCVAVSV